MPKLLRPKATFCGVEFCADLGTLSADVAVIGAPHGTPYKPGEASHAANSPAAVRSALSWFATSPLQMDMDTMRPVFAGARVVDCGDVAGSLSDGAANRAGIEAATRAVLQKGAVPLLLGGDDSTPIPFIRAFEKFAALTVVQIDAHMDWRDERDGVKEGFSSTMRRASEMPWVKTMIQIGIRGPGSARQQDVDDARRWGSQIFTGRDVHAGKLPRAIEAVPKGANVVLTVDVDGLDPSLVPGVILPAYGGIGYQQMLDVIHGIAARATIVGADFVEYSPERDKLGVGAPAIARMASNVISAVGMQRGR